MLRIAERHLNFRVGRSRSVQKQVLEETSGINKRVFMHFFSKTASEKIFLGCEK
jgi:hypothetical protein